MTRCQAYVYKPEQLRRTGRGRSGFERHYLRVRCKRKCAWNQKLCWQHAGDDAMLICGLPDQALRPAESAAEDTVPSSGGKP